MQLSLVEMGINARALQVQANKCCKAVPGAPAGDGLNSVTMNWEEQTPTNVCAQAAGIRSSPWVTLFCNKWPPAEMML